MHRGMTRHTMGTVAVLGALTLAAPAQSSAQQCAGDCNGDAIVGINELITSVNIALQQAPIQSCASVDTGFNGLVGIAELVAGVLNALDGCPESRFRLLGIENAADDLPDRVGDTFIESDICQNICPGDRVELFSSTIIDALIEASPGPTAMVTSIEVMYPERRLVSLRSQTRHLVSAKYCLTPAGFPCELDEDCGTSGSCIAGPTRVAFTALDLARKDLLGGEQCEMGFDIAESPLLFRIRIVDDGDTPIDLIGGTTLIAEDFDNCSIR